MDRRRAVSVFFVAFFILPLLASAQVELHGSNALQPDAAPMVSVRTLQIPEKAAKFFTKGSQLLAARNAAASIAEFEKAIKAFPTFYEAYYKLGIAQLDLQRPDEAQQNFGKSIELSDARFAPPYFALGLILCNQKQFSEAEVTIRSGLNLDPTDSAGNFTLAWVMFSANRLIEAEKSAQEAVLHKATFAMAYLLLAQIHRQQNNVGALVDDLDTYLRLEPNGPRSDAARVVRAQAQHALDLQNGPAVVASTNR
jgi:tetratricopeptide (TPR) repeat protein